MFPRKPFDNFPPEGGSSEGLDAFIFFLNRTAVDGFSVFYLNKRIYLIRTRFLSAAIAPRTGLLLYSTYSTGYSSTKIMYLVLLSSHSV